MRGLRVMLSGGGTGGHVYPALAIGQALRRARPDCELLYVGSARGLEADVVPRAGIPFEAVRAAGVMGRGPLRALVGVVHLLAGTLDALRLVRRFRPHLAVATGGYASVPVALAARLRGVPLAIQEQNAVPGAANRLLGRLAAAIFLPFPETRHYFPHHRQVLVTGNPVRPEVIRTSREEARRELRIPAGAPVLYAFAGSGGAAAVHRALCDALPAVLRRSGLVVLYATGSRYHAEVVERLRRAGLRPDPEEGALRVRPLFYRAELPLAAADLAVVRAGAMTVSELAARGLPAIVIPSPNVAHAHQDANAAVLGRVGAAQVVRESELDAKGLAARIDGLLDDPARLASMAAAARRVARPDAVERIVARLLVLLGGEPTP